MPELTRAPVFIDGLYGKLVRRNQLLLEEGWRFLARNAVAV
jgi:hypothetical protein